MAAKVAATWAAKIRVVKGGETEVPAEISAVSDQRWTAGDRKTKSGATEGRAA